MLHEQLDSLAHWRLLRISVVHWFVLIVWSTTLWRFTGVYRVLYARSALVATMFTNVLLFGISDALAQAIHCYASEAVDPLPPIVDSTVRSLVDIDSDNLSVFNDYGGEAAVIGSMDVEEETEDAPDVYFFDLYRWMCFMAWGFTLSFFQVPWYKFLNFFYTEDPTVVQVLERVLSDQLLYSPVSLYCFFMYSSYVMEGGDAAAFSRKIQRLYVSTLGCNYLVWPAVQFVNFLAVPKHLQVPFSSSVGLAWNCFLSMRNAAR
ncbi:hypothetical protein HG537_0C01500 [Torulaspora globosa]|uniref:Uncharacterized protein n=1 Tax=Torulaspora globosa TaxID=48254 RepID=A0A7H9HQD0_9SACH|nr:hypothetical protein HG537_0C01500 [Torulaspora sp. CBS 2947]